MGRLTGILCAIFTAGWLHGQGTSCSTALIFNDGFFIVWPPAQAQPSIQRCFSFVSPADSVDFSFVVSTSPPGSCGPGQSVSIYTLYDNSCVVDSVNPDGLFVDLQPGGEYVVCFSIACSTGLVTLLLTLEDIVLPVRLVEFTARSTPRGIELKWSTASENACDGFVIERSTDLSRWTGIGFIDGAGYSTQLVSYGFEDEAPVSGINYYRLKQFDIDGNFEIFQTVAIMWMPGVETSPFRTYNILGQKIKQ